MSVHLNGSDTLVRRLREYTTEDETRHSIEHDICYEAADEIERLQQEPNSRKAERPCRVFLHGYEMKQVIDVEINEDESTNILCAGPLPLMMAPPLPCMIGPELPRYRVELMGLPCMLFTGQKGDVRIEPLSESLAP